MGRREFFAWVEQFQDEMREQSGDMAHDSWRNVERNEWWQQARKKRDQMLGR